MAIEMNPMRWLAAALGVLILFLVIGQFSWQYAILITLFLVLVVPFMGAIFSGEH
jgi:hypothetical protein